MMKKKTWIIIALIVLAVGVTAGILYYRKKKKNAPAKPAAGSTGGAKPVAQNKPGAAPTEGPVVVQHPAAETAPKVAANTSAA